MMLNRKLFKQDDILKCDQCNTQFNEHDVPKFLPCFMTICSKCEFTIQKNTKSDMEFKCLICLKYHHIPIDGFSLNERIYALLKSANQSSEEYNQQNKTDLLSSVAKICSNTSPNIKEVKEIKNRSINGSCVKKNLKNKSDDNFVSKAMKPVGRGILGMKFISTNANNTKQRSLYSVYDDVDDDDKKFEDIDPVIIKPDSKQNVLKDSTLIEEIKPIISDNKPEPEVILNPANYAGVLVNATLIEKKIAELKKEDEETIKKLLEEYYGKEKEPSKYLMRYSYFEKIKEENEAKNPKTLPQPNEVEKESKEDIKWIPLHLMPMLMDGEFY